jgi:hypothetical protein
MSQQGAQVSAGADQIQFAAGRSNESQEGRITKAVERLRASRADYLRELTEDARKTGARWLREEASYAQLKYVLWLKANGTAREKFHRAFSVSPLDTVAPRLKDLSSVAEWNRNWIWYGDFVDGVLAEWNKIAADVERD